VPWGKMVQAFMNIKFRFQLAFQAVQVGKDAPVPPGEYNLPLGINEPS
jgi:hypothetical protein